MPDFYSSDIFKAQLIANLKTGNMILDTLIVSIIISFIGWIVNKIQTFNFADYRHNLNKYKLTIKTFPKYNGRQFITTNLKSVLYELQEEKISFYEKVGIYDQFEDLIYFPITKYTKINDEIFITSNKEICEIYDSDTNKMISKEICFIHLWSNVSLEVLDKYVLDCLEKYKKKLSRERYQNKIYKIQDFKNEEYQMTNFETNRTFKSVFFEEKERFLKYLDFFTQQTVWFDSKECPRHLGILLHGEPGCGKTSFIKALAKETKRNIVSINLSNVKTNRDLESIFTYKFYSDSTFENYIYVLEDIDCMCDVVLDRTLLPEENPDKKDKKDKPIIEMIEKDKLNLSGLLNVIDGMIEMPGRIIVITTNHVDKLDKALIRPGRVDFKIEMKKATRQVIGSILQQFYNESIDLSILEKVHDYEKTPAEISDIVKNSFFLGHSLMECVKNIKQR